MGSVKGGSIIKDLIMKRRHIKRAVIILITGLSWCGGFAQEGAKLFELNPAIGLAKTAMDIWKDSAAVTGQSGVAVTGQPGVAVAGQPGVADIKPARWTYEEAVVWLGLIRLWYNTGDARYFKYVRNQVDRLVDKDGNIL